MRRKNRKRDMDYMAFIKRQPCLACVRLFPEILGHLQCSSTEAAHVGERGIGQKCSDRETIPLCGVAHHREGPLSSHRLGKRFWAFHGIDRDAEIARLNAEYDSQLTEVA